MLTLIKSRIKKRKKLLAAALAARSLVLKLLWLFPFLRKKYNPLTNRVALEITTLCNLSCYNCESCSRQAPNNEYMSLAQIEKFVSESIKLNWHWEYITLRGGEPTLHPDFFEMLETIKKYKNFNPACNVTLTTNAFSDKTKGIIKKLPDWIIPSSTESNYTGRDAANIYNTYNAAPADSLLFKTTADYSKGCWRTGDCGLGLSRYGFYPCAPGASADRIFGFDVGIKNLSQVNEGNLRNQMKTLCKYCGHYKEPNEKVLKEKMSKTWVKAFENYKKNKPNLSLY